MGKLMGLNGVESTVELAGRTGRMGSNGVEWGRINGVERVD